LRDLAVRPEAEAELLAAAQWYEDRRVGLGLEFLLVVDQGLERIRSEPLGFPPWRNDRSYRKCVLPRFPYVIFFSVSDAIIDLLAFAHAKRRPGYWTVR
jgi:toxin ParE1/3/4